jgi:hypothetical protein
MVAIRDCLNKIACSNDVEDGRDGNDQQKWQGKWSEDDDPRWVIGTMFHSVLQHMETFSQKIHTVDQLTQTGWGDVADNFVESDPNYGHQQQL